MRIFKEDQSNFYGKDHIGDYNDYHIDTKGSGIINVPYIIDEIKKHGNKAIVTWNDNEGGAGHTEFTSSEDWRNWQRAHNEIAGITDVWITELKEHRNNARLQARKIAEARKRILARRALRESLLDDESAFDNICREGCYVWKDALSERNLSNDGPEYDEEADKVYFTILDNGAYDIEIYADFMKDGSDDVTLNVFNDYHKGKDDHYTFPNGVTIGEVLSRIESDISNH